jgi:hypothetical protein
VNNCLESLWESQRLAENAQASVIVGCPCLLFTDVGGILGSVLRSNEGPKRAVPQTSPWKQGYLASLVSLTVELSICTMSPGSCVLSVLDSDKGGASQDPSWSQMTPWASSDGLDIYAALSACDRSASPTGPEAPDAIALREYGHWSKQRCRLVLWPRIEEQGPDSSQGYLSWHASNANAAHESDPGSEKKAAKSSAGQRSPVSVPVQIETTE